MTLIYNVFDRHHASFNELLHFLFLNGKERSGELFKVWLLPYHAFADTFAFFRRDLPIALGAVSSNHSCGGQADLSLIPCLSAEPVGPFTSGLEDSLL